MTESLGERIKGICPACGPDRWAFIRGTFERTTHHEDMWASTTHRILQCAGCDEVYHQTDDVFSEDYTNSENPITGDVEWDYEHNIKYWPSPNKRQKPKWLPRLLSVDLELFKLLEEVYAGLENNLDVLAAIGVRTTFDRGAELLGIDPSKTFQKKLDDLHAQGSIGVTERNALNVLTDAGSASAHRGWRPDSQHIQTLMEMIESFVHRNFVLIEDISVLKNAIPARQRSQTTQSSS